MRALVTGANSLIGSNLVRALIKKGFKVRALIRQKSDRRSLEGLPVELAFGDIFDLESLVKAAEKCKTVYHAAAIFSYHGHTRQSLEDVAVAGTKNVIRAAKLARARRVVLTSSSVVMGSTSEPSVLDEENVSPEAEPNAYTLSKIKQEETGFRLAEEAGVDLVAVCPTLCVGPHDYRLTESNAIILNYLNDPFRATWPGGCNIVGVEDVALGHILASRSGKKFGRYILGSQNLSWSAVHRIISELSGIHGPLTNATHTSCLLAGVIHESIISKVTGRRPVVTRSQAKMVGRYYWYSHERAARLGYRPMPARHALAKAISWLAASHHVSASVRNRMTLSEEVYDQRQ